LIYNVVSEVAMKEIFILRHGETEWNVEMRMQGRLDSPLTENGKAQAGSNGVLLKSLGEFGRLYVSPSGRTRETAAIVNAQLQAEVALFESLMERDVGRWSGLTVSEIEIKYPRAWAVRQADPYGFRPPDGENLDDMLERVQETLEEIYLSDPARVGIVTHGVMSKVILKYFLNLEPAETQAIRHPNNLVYRLTFHRNEIDTQHFLDGRPVSEGLYLG
jgi:probable phosphoglycerate mutase